MMHWPIFTFICISIFDRNSVWGQYQVPDPTIEAFTPKGFRIFIPDETGIKVVAFHVKINEEFTKHNTGQLSAEIIKPTNGIWVYEYDDLKLNIGDEVHYWLFVQIGSVGYRLNPKKWIIREHVNRDEIITDIEDKTPGIISNICEETSTIVKGNTPCGGKLIFEENFDGNDINKTIWQYEQYIPKFQDYEFVSYQKHNTNVFVKDGFLHIKPTLLEDILVPPNSVVNGILDLFDGCTRPSDAECYHQSKSFNILPPVISGKIITKKSFSFKYGKIEIRAKFPKGDWIIPQLHLKPITENYGMGYESGVINVAMSYGNDDLYRSSTNVSIDSCELFSGMMLGLDYPMRDIAMKKHRSPQRIPWNRHFHTYSLTWKPNNVIMTVDNKIFGNYEPPAEGYGAIDKQNNQHGTTRWRNPQAPFDKEFYISIGVAVGGIFEFQDDVFSNGKKKPWRNSADALLNFWRATKDWYPTWNESDLIIDYIKVYAL